MLDYDGRSMCLTDWSKERGIPLPTIIQRLKAGWTIGETLGFEERYDELGKRYGKLVVVREHRRSRANKGHITDWVCLCDCGEETVAEGQQLRGGLRISCGCSNMKFISYGDRTQTAAKWSEETKIPRRVILRRLKLGWTPGQVLGFERPRLGVHNRTITYGGETLTQAEWSRRTGLSQEKISHRLTLGWPAGQVLGLESREKINHNAVMVTIEGGTHSKSEWARRLGISLWQFIDRCTKYSTKDEIVGATNPQHCKITIRGETKTIQQWARLAGIKTYLVYQRIHKQGWTPEEAVFGKAPVEGGCTNHPSRPARGLSTGEGREIRICWGCMNKLRRSGTACSEIVRREHSMSGCSCERCEQKRTTARERVREFYRTASAEDREHYRALMRKWNRDSDQREISKFLDQFSQEDREFITSMLRGYADQ
jgi:hypothetical protein